MVLSADRAYCFYGGSEINPQLILGELAEVGLPVTIDPILADPTRKTS